MHISATALAANSRSLTLLSLVLSAASVCSAANITYNVNLTVGSASVSGTITTDGTIGGINDSNILDWNLLLNDPTIVIVFGHQTTLCGSEFIPTPCTVTLLGPKSGSMLASDTGTDLSATAAQLLFNFSGTDNSSDHGDFLFETGNLGAVCFEAATNCLSPAFGAGVSLYINPSHVSLPGPPVDYQFASLSGTQVIGTAAGSSTPEPSALTLLGAGIALLGLSKLRIRFRP